MKTLPRNPYLWNQAKARARFQAHLMSFLFVNATLWVIWAFTAPHYFGRHMDHHIPWPLWVTFFWGLSIVRRGISAYGSLTHEQRAEREYERLTREPDRATPRAKGSIDPLDKYR